MKALLALEDGRIFEGISFGASGERAGEVVFNTGMTGYQEVLTDPSYKGQIVAMTYPLIGNYGINERDSESRSVWLEGFVVRELSGIASNWQSREDLVSYMHRHHVVGIQGIDTRALTMHIRTTGAMKAVISTIDHDPQTLLKKVRNSPDLEGRDLVSGVTCQESYDLLSKDGTGPKVIVLDFGVKTSILNQLRHAGCHVTVVPADTTIDEILGFKPAGVMLSNGPGDPAAVTYAIDTIRALLEIGSIPLFGVCLGQQLLGLALGGKTFKLKFGHHGSNHPVKDMQTGKVYITVQNHGFCVDIDSLDRSIVDVTHVNLNDRTLEGIRHKKLPVFSVQFHPEAGPGPHDARHLFGRFVEMVKNSRN
ncbi:MAG TPA: glutamine-hydrolyzing carbamoyl-phosphate synthase small subunit [Desulfobacterales bacterium]|nr:glutamine-hydrolyzing carbamoyl-phosphate synthase small subunit [Desulfobacterales bacterium]